MVCFGSVYLGTSLPVHLRGSSRQAVPGAGWGFGFGSSFLGQDPSAQVRCLDLISQTGIGPTWKDNACCHCSVKTSKFWQYFVLPRALNNLDLITFLSLERYCQQVLNETVRTAKLTPVAARLQEVEGKVDQHVIPKEVSGFLLSAAVCLFLFNSVIPARQSFSFIVERRNDHYAADDKEIVN